MDEQPNEAREPRTRKAAVEQSVRARKHEDRNREEKDEGPSFGEKANAEC
jgi:hypothetical protein